MKDAKQLTYEGWLWGIFCEFDLTKDAPYLTLTGELWGIFDISKSDQCFAPVTIMM